MNKTCVRLTVSLICGLQACTTAPLRTALDQRIESTLRTGQQAIGRDDWQRADLAFAQAQGLARSVDDDSRWAQASLNRAWLVQRRGEDDTPLLQQVANQPAVPESLRTEARLRQAASALRRGDLNAATTMLSSLEKHPPTARWLGLNARLALALEASAQARSFAQSQLAAATTEAAGKPSAEAANAHRLLARLDMQIQQWPSALAHLQQAETLDLALQDSEALLQGLALKVSVHLAQLNAVQADAEQQRLVLIQQAYCARFAQPWAPARCRKSLPTGG